MSNSKFQIFKGKDRKFYFRLVTTNGKVTMASQGYSHLKSCTKGVASVKANGGNFDRYEFCTTVNDKYYFVLKASNNEVIGKSDTHSTQQRCRNGVMSVIDVMHNIETEKLV